MGKVIRFESHPARESVVENPWQKLKDFTSARIALGRCGSSVPTNEWLSFSFDHAKAMDAVHCALDIRKLAQDIAQSSVMTSQIGREPIVVKSKANDRFEYLQRPDFGRELSKESMEVVAEHRQDQHAYDLAFVVADGLSSVAIQRHAVPLLEALLVRLTSQHNAPWRIAPITIVEQGRVAVGDDVAQCLNANMVVVLIGERPGLTSPDSMGMYLTWGAKRGSKDSERNCISNIRPQGLNYSDAAFRASYLLEEARSLKLTGVNLKDRSSMDEQQDGLTLGEQHQSNFLISKQ